MPSALLIAMERKEEDGQEEAARMKEAGRAGQTESLPDQGGPGRPSLCPTSEGPGRPALLSLPRPGRTRRDEGRESLPLQARSVRFGSVRFSLDVSRCLNALERLFRLFLCCQIG